MKKVENTVIDGIVDNKSKDTVAEKVNGSAVNHKSDKLESQMHEPVKESNNRVPSAKSDEKTHVEVSDRGTVEEVDNKSDTSVEKGVEDTNATEKYSSTDCATKPTTQMETCPSVPSSAGDKSNKSDPSSASNLPNQGLSSNQSLEASAESQNKPQVTSAQDQRLDEQKSNRLPKSPEKSEKEQESEISTTEINQTQQELKIPGKSPEKSRESTPAENNVDKNEEELQVSSKSPNGSPLSTPEIKQSQTDNEKKVDGQNSSETKDNQMKEESKATSKMETEKDRSGT